MSLPVPLVPGMLVNNYYRIDNLINHGPNTATYAASEVSEGLRSCIIKEFYPQVLELQQLQKENAVSYMITHPHLAQFYNAFESTGRFYLVMQKVEGQSLDRMLERPGDPLREYEVVHWLLPVIKALNLLHERTPAIVHRDIQPCNLIIQSNRRTVLVNFRVEGDGVTDGYSPPEQYRRGSVGPEADIYALGATFYFLLTGQAPIAAPVRDIDDTLIPPRRLNPEISLKMESILLKALALNPEERYSNVHDLVDALLSSVPWSGETRKLTMDEMEDRKSREFVSDLIMALASSSVPSTPPLQEVMEMPSIYQRFRVAITEEPEIGVPLSLPISAGMTRISQALWIEPPPSQPQPITDRSKIFVPGGLWGLLQAVISASILLIWPTPGVMTPIVAFSFLLYACVGFSITRRGEPAWLGALVGAWTGICSAIASPFFIILSYLLLSIFPGSAFSSGHPTLVELLLLALPLGVTSPSTNVLVLELLSVYGAGLLMALGCGWLGGSLGQVSYQKHQRLGARSTK